ncbi:MAG: sulfotransferase domain-containing protein [Planctomycetes bacterium]|nr:sulfotransferase domain-containing protein [Planctomycetota bacterium]
MAGSALRIVVAEYPRSGGTWLANLLGDALEIHKRDIYIVDGYPHYDARRHPWYAGAQHLGLTESCVIKSHELPGSPLVGFDARQVHLLRDGRDVVVSRFFYEADLCVRNGIYEKFDEPFDAYVPRVAREWREFVRAWREVAVPTVRYEELLEARAASLAGLLREFRLGVAESAVRRAVESNTRELMRKAMDSTYDHNTFVRVGDRGDWRNHFRPRHEEAFMSEAGELLRELGYL